MNITYNNITIDFFNFKELIEKSEYDQGIKLDSNNVPYQIVVSLSGGLDSLSAFYLSCKHFPDVEYIPITAKDVNAPKDAIAAKLIVKTMQEMFPNVNIRDIRTFEFNDKDPSSWPIAEEYIEKYERYSKLNKVQMSKIVQLDNINNTVMKEFDQPLRIDGMTKNPPINDMKNNNFFEMAERRRDTGGKPNLLYNVYQPFINVDKKFVADIYKQNNLMDNLYPLTRSCVGTARQTDNFARECHNCFWCHEKKWAFDLEWSK